MIEACLREDSGRRWTDPEFGIAVDALVEIYEKTDTANWYITDETKAIV